MKAAVFLFCHCRWGDFCQETGCSGSHGAPKLGWCKQYFSVTAFPFFYPLSDSVINVIPFVQIGFLYGCFLVTRGKEDVPEGENMTLGHYNLFLVEVTGAGGLSLIFLRDQVQDGSSLFCSSFNQRW